MGRSIMAADGASGVAAAVFGKTAGFLLAGLATAFVSAVAVAIGFTVVPLTPGKEHIDAARRLGAGLLCSFTLGPIVAFKFIDWQPDYLAHWVKIIGEGEGRVLVAYLAAGAPFLAFTAIIGFWLVAAVMRWFQKREGKDIGELAADARADIGKAAP